MLPFSIPFSRLGLQKLVYQCLHLFECEIIRAFCVHFLCCERVRHHHPIVVLTNAQPDNGQFVVHTCAIKISNHLRRIPLIPVQATSDLRSRIVTWHPFRRQRAAPARYGYQCLHISCIFTQHGSDISQVCPARLTYC